MIPHTGNTPLPQKAGSAITTTPTIAAVARQPQTVDTFTKGGTRRYGYGAGGTIVGGVTGAFVGSLLGIPGAVAGGFVGAGGLGYAGYQLGSAADIATAKLHHLDAFLSAGRSDKATVLSLVEDAALLYRQRELLATSSTLRDKWDVAHGVLTTRLRTLVVEQLIEHQNVKNINVDLLVRLLIDSDAQQSPVFLQDAYPMLAQLDRVSILRSILQALCTSYVPRGNTAWDATYAQRQEVIEALLGEEVPTRARALEIAASFASALGLDSPQAVVPLLFSATAAAQWLDPTLITPALTALGSGIGTRMFERNQGISPADRQERKRFERVHDAIKKQSAADVASLPSAVQAKIKNTDYEIKRAIAGGDLALAKHLLRRRQGPLLSFSTRPKLLLPQASSDNELEARTKRIDAAVEQLLNDYDHIPNLRDYVDAIRDNSQTTGEGTARIQIFLVGESGVGKSHFIRRLAEALELPCIDESLRTKADLDAIRPPSALGGMKASQFTFGSAEVSDKELLTVIPNAMARAGCTNPIIFFDEAGELMSVTHAREQAEGGFFGRPEDGVLARLKYILQEETKTIDSPWMADNGMAMDFTHANLIFAGNVEPVDDALRERLIIIRFPALPPSKKRLIAGQAIDAASRSAVGLPEGTVESIRTHAMEHLDLLMTMDAASQKPGAHTLKRAAIELVRKVRMQTTRTGKGKLSGHDVRRLLRSQFGLDANGSRIVGSPAAAQPQAVGLVASGNGLASLAALIPEAGGQQ